MKGVQIANGSTSTIFEAFQGISYGRDVGRFFAGLFLRQGFGTKTFREAFELLAPRRALLPATLQAEKFLLSFATLGAELFQQGLVTLRLRLLTFDENVEIASLSGGFTDEFQSSFPSPMIFPSHRVRKQVERCRGASRCDTQLMDGSLGRVDGTIELSQMLLDELQRRGDRV